ncbi:hypothetical protein KCU98_g3067, partial [Aureobasidium melanogenum]
MLAKQVEPSATWQDRSIVMEGTLNMRDLGGLCTSDGRHIIKNRLFRSANLAQITSSDLQTLAQLGIKTVVDLRGPKEALDHPDRLPAGVAIIPSPIIGSDTGDAIHDSTMRTLVLCAGLPETMLNITKVSQHGPYYRMLYLVNSYGTESHTSRLTKYRPFFRALLDLAPGETILVHCTGGRDRTGVGIALWLKALGVSQQDIEADFLASNHALQPDREDPDSTTFLRFHSANVFLQPPANKYYQRVAKELGAPPESIRNAVKLRADLLRPTGSRPRSGIAGFFAPDVFQAVLSDPATAMRLKSFCDSNACSENIDFLEKIEQYRSLLAQAQELLLHIHATYTSTHATEPINITETISKSLTSAIDTATSDTFYAMQDIFAPAQRHVEDLIRDDVYPRFVTHQLTTSASMALAHDRKTYQGLGDCFCLTDPSIADNAILYASDGFIDVTGYSRRDIIPRNCRFLQGAKTDRSSVIRLKSAINNGQETVQLLLNYRKDGTPFWNLLYVAPLHDEAGNTVFFLGGQIDCSTTIHGRPDVMKILELDDRKALQAHRHDLAVKDTSNPTPASPRDQFKRHRHIFKSTSHVPTEIRQGPGMEHDLIKRLGGMGLETQMQMFQTAYSNYVVLKMKERSGFSVAHYSTSANDLLRLSRTQGTTERIMNEDIFKVLAERSPSSSTVMKSWKKTVTDLLAQGKAVSVDIDVIVEERAGNAMPTWPVIKSGRCLVTHWTPCKNKEGQAKYVVLILAESREL